MFFKYVKYGIYIVEDIGDEVMDTNNKLLDGKECSKKYREMIKEQISQMEYKPKMVIIQVGDDERSNMLVRGKEKACTGHIA